MTEIWPYTVSLAVTMGMVHLVLFLILLFRRKKEVDQQLTLLYLGMSILWGIATTLADLRTVFIPAVTDTSNSFIPVFATALAVLELLLACSFLEFPILAILATAGGTWTVVLLIGTIYFALVPPPLLPLLQVAQGGWAVITTVLIVLAVLALFRSHLALYRNRVLYWLMTAVALTAGQAATMLPAGPLRVTGLLFHVAGVIALVRGTASYWLPNVKATLRSTLRFLLLSAVTAALLLGITLGAEWLTDLLPLPHLALVSALAVVAALIYLPLYRLLQHLVDRLLAGVGFDPAQALRDYSQLISTVLDLEQLAHIAVQTVANVLDVRRGALLVTSETERGGLELQPVPGLGEVEQEPVEMEPISPILARIREQDTPLFQYEVEHHPTLRAAAHTERAWLRSLEMEVYLPIYSQDKLAGLLALGPQGTGEPYSERMLEFLSTLAHQTGVALQNASLFEGLRALNAHITELNENLRAAYERLERLDKAKTDFLSIASHELRTPVTQLRGYTDILTELAATEGLSQDQILRIAGNIVTPLRRLENIITAILDASRIDAEGLSLRFVPATLASTMRMAIENWTSALEERHINMVTHHLDDIAPIQADTQRLFQAFSNILSNAIKFTPDGGSITIAAHPLDDEHFEVTITDTGIGISRADQELIFEKFYRVGSVSLHSSGDYKFKGAGPGLGLPIARGVIEGHGGCIWVESEGYDEVRCPGSTFHIVLPYKAHHGTCRWQRPAASQRGQGESAEAEL